MGDDPKVWRDRVVSRMTLPIGVNGGLGALSLGHAEGHERGFTSLCQRIGRALANSAEPLLIQAIAHEQLTTEREQYARATRTDPLTGVGNRAAWERSRSHRRSSRPAEGAVRCPPLTPLLSADVDGLKNINDRHGHRAGDAALRAAADFLRFSLRPSDALCRVGGDEFVAILPNVDERVARQIVRRLRAEMDERQQSKRTDTPRLSIGWAVVDEDWDDALFRADKRMYDDKRTHAGSADGQVEVAASPRPRRRRTDPVTAA